jgi:hypothetical protein
MAVAMGTTDVDQGQGCPDPSVTESCTGPYYLFDGSGTDATFRAFTVTHDIYLDPSTAGPNGTEVDEDTELNTSTGAFGVDNTVGFCAESGAFTVTSSHGSPAGCTGPAAITSSGWVRVVWVFSNVSGYAYLTENVWQKVGGSLTKVWTSGPQPVILPGDTSAEPTSAVGGPGYFWEPTEQLPGFLPETNLALQLGQHSSGETP